MIRLTLNKLIRTFSWLAAIFIISCSSTSQGTEPVSAEEVIDSAIASLAVDIQDITIGVNELCLIGTNEATEYSVYLANGITRELLQDGYTV